MSRQDAKALMDILAGEGNAASPIQVQSATIEQYYKDAVAARSAFLVSEASTVTTPRQAKYALPTNAIRISAIFADGDYLDETKLADVEVVSEDWRDLEGTPISYVVEAETSRTFRLFPNPVAPITLTILYEEARTDAPRWMDLPLALDVLSREFARESDHKDDSMAQAFGRISSAFYFLIGEPN